MYLVVSDEYLEKLLADPTAERGDLLGEVADNGAVVRLISFYHPNRTKVGQWRRGPVEPTAQAGEILLTVQDDHRHFELVGAPDELEVERLSFFNDFQSRIDGLFDTNGLAEKTVAVIGLGTGGSIAAVELAKAGVGKLKLADFDRLKVHNLVRHVCGMNDIGRLKTDALRDFLYNTSPMVEVETFDFDVTTDNARLEELIDGCDLVVGAADSEEAKAMINALAWAKGIPAVYGAAYQMGFGGDVYLAHPHAVKGACYFCFRIATGDIFGEQPHEQIADYGRIRPQPALSMDVGMVALIMSRAALSTLLENDKTTRLQPYPANWVLWGNQRQRGWIFDGPLQSRMVDVPKSPDCPVCGAPADLAIQAEAARLVEELSAPPELPAGLKL